MTAEPPEGTETATTEVGADGAGFMVTDLDKDLGEVPVSFVAVTEKAYVIPSVRPVPVALEKTIGVVPSPVRVKVVVKYVAVTV